MKIGSLFDGSGGFPLAASLCGIEPVWASEVEPYPIAVTRSRFPGMKHLGDISEINGAEIEPATVLSFGAPCQDLSVAGRRAGLRHESLGHEETTRSGLFMEAVRIIKEMWEATHGEYPRFCIYENVPGAFSSSGGEDFRTVLEELIKIVEPTAVMPEVPKGGWAYADSFCGNGWSLAWRVFDAQYIRTAQRRRRLYLVLDLRGQCARSVLFERESLRGYYPQIGAAWKAAAGDAERSIGVHDRASCVRCYESHPMDSRIKELGDDVSPTVSVKWHKGAADTPLVCEQYLFENHSQDARYRGPLAVCPMLPAQLGTGGNNQPFVVEKSYSLQGNTIDRDAKQNGNGISEDVAHTLNSVDRHGVVLCMAHGQANAEILEDKSPCLNCNHEQPIACFQNTGQGWWNESDVGATIRTPCGGDAILANVVVENRPVRYIVRRLTPVECARLQGFPDCWGDIDPKEDFTDEEYRFWLDVRNTHAAINGKAVKDYTKKQMLTWYNKLHTDTAEYKLWGNGLALPCALYVMQGIADAMNGGGENAEA